MKVLLDECVPWPMHRFLVGHECMTAQQCGWGGIKNGELLRKAEGQFDVFVTADQNIRYQQNLAQRLIRFNLRSIASSRATIAAWRFPEASRCCI